MAKSSASKAAADNRANQLNPQHPAFHQGRGTPHGVAVVTADQVRASNEAKSAEPAGSTMPSDDSAGSGK